MSSHSSITTAQQSHSSSAVPAQSHTSITNPALLPRATNAADDPYGLTSLYNQITAMYPSSLYPELYATTGNDGLYPADYLSIYNSLLVDYSAMFSSLLGTNTNLASVTVPSGTGLGGLTTMTQPRATRATRTSARTLTPTAVGASGSTFSDSGSGGLSTSAKIGIGAGVALAVLLSAGLGLLLWCIGKRKGKKSSTTIVAPSQTHFTPQQQIQQQQQQHPPPQAQPQMADANNNQVWALASPPPQYAQPHPPLAQNQDYMGAYGAAGKGPSPGVGELEQEYHFAKPGAIELSDGLPEAQQQGSRK